MIGIDSEWRPPLTKFDIQRPGLLQLSSKQAVYLIDLISLSKSKILDEMLIQIFTHPDTLCIGFSFQSDLTIFERCFTNMHFFKTFTNFIEVQDYYSAVQSIEMVTSLAKAVKSLFDLDMCKEEQMSNWEKRPLRFS